jgi:hypothetical protein
MPIKPIPTAAANATLNLIGQVNSIICPLILIAGKDSIDVAYYQR